jgi:hypothetical protein
VTRNHRGDRAAGHTDSSDASLTRRDFFKGAGLTGLTAACPLSLITEDANAGAADGTPEQRFRSGNRAAQDIDHHPLLPCLGSGSAPDFRLRTVRNPGADERPARCIAQIGKAVITFLLDTHRRDNVGWKVNRIEKSIASAGFPALEQSECEPR